MFCTLDLACILPKAAYVIFHYWYQSDCLSLLEIRLMVTSSFHNLCRVIICV